MTSFSPNQPPITTVSALPKLTSEHVVVVVPTYNERENIVPFTEAIRTRLHDQPFALLFVDDNSPDGTGAEADRLASEHDDVFVLHRPDKAGIGPAYVHGFNEALASGAGLIAQMDCDFSHNPDDLVKLIAAARDGAGLTIGSRYVPGGNVSGFSRSRLMVSKGASKFSSLLMRVNVRDLSGGFKVWSAHVLRALGLQNLISAGFCFQAETTYRACRAGVQPVEVPISFRDRSAGTSKMTASMAVEGLWALPKTVYLVRRQESRS